MSRGCRFRNNVGSTSKQVLPGFLDILRKTYISGNIIKKNTNVIIDLNKVMLEFVPVKSTTVSITMLRTQGLVIFEINNASLRGLAVTFSGISRYLTTISPALTRCNQ